MSKADWPAFPAMHFDLRENERGITIRDYFASWAMREMNWRDKDSCAKQCYDIADAMLKAREQ